jgi:hypothetical protein
MLREADEAQAFRPTMIFAGISPKPQPDDPSHPEVPDSPPIEPPRPPQELPPDQVPVHSPPPPDGPPGDPPNPPAVASAGRVRSSKRVQSSPGAADLDSFSRK